MSDAFYIFMGQLFTGFVGGAIIGIVGIVLWGKLLKPILLKIDRIILFRMWLTYIFTNEYRVRHRGHYAFAKRLCAKSGQKNRLIVRMVIARLKKSHIKQYG